jgi:hypothetical protein
MKYYIHDHEFEADYIYDENYDEEQMSLGERLSILNDEYITNQNKKVDEFQNDEISAFLRDLKDLMEDADDDELFCKESIYLMFKSLTIPVSIEYLRYHQSFSVLCKWKAIEILEMLDDIEQENSMWRNIKTVVTDFLLLDVVKNL